MYTDLHCHLLAGIDDGPPDMAGAFEMARVLVSLGFDKVVATPHALPQFPGAEVAAERARELSEKLVQEGMALQIFEGAENRLTAEFMQAELEGRGRHLGGTRYTLVEPTYETVVPMLPELLFRLRRKGVRPLIAHPERCAHFEQLDRAEEAVRGGAALQLDLGSLVGRYGKLARKTALRLLDAGLYAVAATDLHQALGAQAWGEDALRQLEKWVGRSGLERLLNENPARLLRDEELS